MSNNPHPWLLPTQKRGPAELADQDENLVQIATDIPEDPENLYTAKSGPNAQRKEWGNVFPVQVNVPSSVVGFGNSTVQGALNTPNFDTEQDCTVILQILPSQSSLVPVPPGSSPGTVYFTENQVLATITYGVGAATLTKRITLSSPALRRVQLCARNVQVQLQAIFVNPPKTGQITVAVAVVPGHMALRDAYTWMQCPPLRAGNGGNVWPPAALYTNVTGQTSPDLTQGIVGNLKATLTATSSPGTPYYLLLMDLPPTYAGLTGVELPMIYGVSPPMLNVGDSVSFNGLEMPEACTFVQGLWVSLSTTPNIYTAPPASPLTQFSFDALIGQ